MEPNDTSAEAGTVSDSAVEKSTVDLLADILDDPETDTEETKAHAEDDDDVTPREDDDEEPSEEDSDEEDQDEKQDEPVATGGRFVEHTARVKLPDGTTTTVQELAKGYLRQSDYTRKRQEDAEYRKGLDSDKQRVSETAQHLQTQLDRVGAMLEQWKPQRPEVSPADDPVAWMTYQQQMEAWKDWQGRLDAESKSLKEKSEKERSETTQKALLSEARLLVEKFPAMADDAKRTTFFREAARTMASYGFSEREIMEGVTDHRFVLVMRDIMSRNRLAAKAPQVAVKVKEKPKMIRGGKRGSDPAIDARRAKIERLRETGSRADARRALMDLDL